MIEHKRVTSSHVYSLGHHGSTLEARFACGECGGAGCPQCSQRGHGPTYVYENVLPETFAAIKGAESVGKAFREHIVKTKKEFTKR